MQFKTLYDELTQSTQMIRTLIAGITQSDAEIRPAAEAWSMLEVICHLYDEEREDFREHLDFILHRSTETWHPIDPLTWVTERQYNQQDFGEMQEKFFGERARSLEWLRTLSGAAWETVYTSQFGTLSAGDMFAAWVAHDNLHIRQLVELRRHRIEQIATPFSVEYAGDW